MSVAVDTMRAAALRAPGSVETVEARIPRPGPGELLIRVEGCGVCASSLPLWQGREWFSYPLEPGAPGHEVWGLTADGRRVAILSQHGYAEWDVAREDDVVELDGVLDEIPFPGEALACAVNVVERARIRRGARVAVVGMGFLGTTCARLCEFHGASVTEVRRNEQVDGPFERVLEAAGTQVALDTAASLVAERGLLVIAGFHQDGPRTIDLQSWNWRGIDVVNAHERDPRAYVRGLRKAVELVARGELDVGALVTHRLGLEELDIAFGLTSERPEGFLKAVVCP
jgi:threonine dehydrogenase-like Zn-dependent dehydrogenase